MIDAFRRQQLLDLCTGFQCWFDRLDLHVQLQCILGGPLQRWYKVLQRCLRFIAVVQAQTAQILTELALHTDL